MTSRSRTTVALFAALLACAVLGAPSPGSAGDAVSFEVFPTKLWIGLKNSDDIGTYLDLSVTALDAEGNLTALGEVSGVRSGGSGFHNARIVNVDMFRVVPSFPPLPGPPVRVQIDARIACFVRGHHSATIVLWYNGLPVDTGRFRDAGSRISYAIADATISLFLRPSDVLSGVPGRYRLPVAMNVVGPRLRNTCADFKSLGTWEVAAGPQ
jgi:hypothetical protein